MILITGASGFVGRRCMASFPDRAPVMGMGRHCQGPDMLAADLTDKKSLEKLKDLDIHTVIHLASLIAGSETDFFEPNIVGTYNLLSALKGHNLKKIILLSSVSVYGTYNCTEDNYEYTTDAYGRSKLIQEFLVSSFCMRSKTNYIILRTSSIYGPGYSQNTILPLWYNRSKRNEDLKITSKNYRQNFIHVDDVVSVIKKAADSNLMGTYNLFSDDSIFLEELAECIVHVTRSTSRIVKNYEVAVEQPKVFNNEKLKRDLNHSFIPLEKGLLTLG